MDGEATVEHKKLLRDQLFNFMVEQPCSCNIQATSSQSLDLISAQPKSQKLLGFIRMGFRLQAFTPLYS